MLLFGVLFSCTQQSSNEDNVDELLVQKDSQKMIIDVEESPNIILGVVETRQTDFPQNKSSAYSSFARLLFCYSNNQWNSLVFDAEKGNIYSYKHSFDEKELITDLNFLKEYYLIFNMQLHGSVNLEKIIEPNVGYLNAVTLRNKDVPLVGKPNLKFTSLYAGGTSYRPLVISSSDDNYLDPKSWKLDNNINLNYSSLYAVIKDKVEEEKEIATNGNDEEYYDVLSSIAVDKYEFRKMYKASDGDLLVNLRIETSENWVYYNDLQSIWIYIDGQTTVPTFLGFFYELVEAADFDKDGSSDLLFYNTGLYNEDGYVLLYNNLKNEQSFYFEYN